MKALVIESHKERRELIALTIESEFHISATAVSGIEEAIHALLDEESIDLIICEDSESTPKLFKYLASVQSKIPLIVIRNHDPVLKEAFPDLCFLGLISYQNLKSELISLISNGLQSSQIEGSFHDQDYCKISTDLLLKTTPLEADVYIRLSDNKFIKMFRKGSAFTAEDAKKYLEKKKIKYLFIHKSQSKEFLKKLSTLLDDVISGKDKSIFKLETYPESLHQALHSLWSQLGFSEPVRELAKKSVEVVLQSVNQMPSLLSLLQELKKKDKEYISHHSMATGQVACSLAAKLNWSSEMTFKKLTYAALFHDIALPNSHLAQVANTPEWRKDLTHLGVNERKIVVNHPTNIANMALKFKELPPDVDIIIREHHERPSGKGFPLGLTADKISPLSAVFILAHDLIDYTLSGGNLSDLNTFLNKYDYAKMHTAGTFLDLLKALDENVFVRRKAS